jgi:hypothetical protein
MHGHGSYIQEQLAGPNNDNMKVTFCNCSCGSHLGSNAKHVMTCRGFQQR